MLVTVASSRHCSPFTLLDEPLWELAWTYRHLEEAEERRALLRRMERVDMGYMTARAVNAPGTLADEMESVQRAIAAYEQGADAGEADLEGLRARGEAMVARLEAGRVLTPAGLIQ